MGRAGHERETAEGTGSLCAADGRRYISGCDQGGLFRMVSVTAQGAVSEGAEPETWHMQSGQLRGPGEWFRAFPGCGRGGGGDGFAKYLPG